MSPKHTLGAAGVGLYRTEFLFLQRNKLPDEEEQFQTYRDTVLRMNGRPVTIRTLDLGADKTDCTGLTLSNEENPAMGLRGIRLSMAHPQWPTHNYERSCAPPPMGMSVSWSP